MQDTGMQVRREFWIGGQWSLARRWHKQTANVATGFGDREPSDSFGAGRALWGKLGYEGRGW